MELLVKQSASTFRGGYYSHGKQFIAKLPIYRINFSDPEQKSFHDAIVEKVHIIEKLGQKLIQADTSASKNNYRRLVDSSYNELTELIDDLYGVADMNLEDTCETD